MRFTVPHVLLIMVATVVAIDCVWAVLGRFSLDVMGYLKLALMSAVLSRARHSTPRVPIRDWRPCRLASPAPFPPAPVCSITFLLRLWERPSIRYSADRMLGFDWYKTMVAMASYLLE